MKKLLLAICVSASLSFAAGPAPAAAPAAPAAPPTVVKEASGEAAVVNGDFDKAYSQATDVALREAVAQAAGMVIEANSLTKNSTLVRDEIASHSQGYVKSYEVTSKTNAKTVVKVTVKATVATQEIDKDLAIVRSIVSRLGRSKLLIVTQESLIDQKGNNTKGEQLSAALVDVFRNDGWRIIDEKGTGLQTDKLVLSAGTGQTLDKKEIAKAGDVDYVVYGTVSLRYVPAVDNQRLPERNANGEQIIFWVEGQYDLAMLETRTGRNLAKVAGKLGFHSLESTKKVLVGYEFSAKTLAEGEAPGIVAKLRAPVMEYLRDQVVNGSEVELKVSGLPNLKSVEDMQKELLVVHGVKDARPNGDFSNGSMVFTVHVEGTAYDLGQALDQAKVLKQKLKVTTKSVTNNQVEIALAK